MRRSIRSRSSFRRGDVGAGDHAAPARGRTGCSSGTTPAAAPSSRSVAAGDVRAGEVERAEQARQVLAVDEAVDRASTRERPRGDVHGRPPMRAIELPGTASSASRSGSKSSRRRFMRQRDGSPGRSSRARRLALELPIRRREQRCADAASSIDQPSSTKSAASQSSNSGWRGRIAADAEVAGRRARAPRRNDASRRD